MGQTRPAKWGTKSSRSLPGGTGLGSGPTARITRLAIDPPDAEPLPEALDAIRAADLILIGPGSLYTSILPNLMIHGMTEAIRASHALRVYTCNVMTQPGETDGYSAEDHLAAIFDHVGPIVDAMIVNERRPSARTLEAYAVQHFDQAVGDAA